MEQKVKISSLIAGTMNWGKWGSAMTTSQMNDMIHTCVENQITTFDHADIYGAHTTESDFGKAFVASKLAREAIQIITKCGIKYPADNRDYVLKHYDYSVEHIMFSVENSLKQLQTDYLDVLLLHRPSPLLQPEVVAEAFSKLKKEGKVNDFGVSNFTNTQIDLLKTAVPIDYNQIQFSVSEHTAMLDGRLDYMTTHSIKPMAWNPLGSIFKENSLQNQSINNVLNKLAVKYKTTTDVILLAWIIKHPSGITPVLGTSNKDRIATSVKATQLFLEQEDWFALWEASLGHKVP